MRLLLFTVLLITVACRSKPTEPNPHFDGQALSTDGDRKAGSAPKIPTAPTGIWPVDAAIALTEAGISLTKNPNYSKDNAISGICYIGEADLTRVPCRYLRVELIDSGGSERGSTTSDDLGRFAFYAKSEKKYSLRVADPRYRMIEPNRQYEMGDVAALTLEAVRR